MLGTYDSSYAYPGTQLLEVNGTRRPRSGRGHRARLTLPRSADEVAARSGRRATSTTRRGASTRPSTGTSPPCWRPSAPAPPPVHASAGRRALGLAPATSSPSSPAPGSRWPTEGAVVRVLFSSTFGSVTSSRCSPLARAFLAAGHDVLWAAGADAGDRPRGRGLPAAPAGLTGPRTPRAGRSLRDRDGLCQRRRSGRPSSLPRLFGETLAPPMASRPAPSRARVAADLLVHEHGELASPLVGAVLRGAEPDPRLRRSRSGRACWPTPVTAWAACGPSTGTRCLRTPAASPATYLDICPPSVRSEPRDHVPPRQPLRPVADIGGPAEQSPAPASPTGDRSST